MANGCAVDRRREEPMVPVFTVVKNGAIFKNIFVINNGLLPPSSLSSEVRQFDLMDDLESQEEVLIVGRHPDCNILLTHPSISRFHLKILSNPSEQKISVLDLSSVHGTWISDTRIDPWVLVEMKEGDTIRVGGSSRVYRLHWVPLSSAYDCENWFVSALDLAAIEEKEEEHEHQDEYSEEAETVNACVVTEEAEIFQSKDFGVDENITNQSVDLRLDSSIASLPLHDLEKTVKSTEFQTPIGGNLSVDRFQSDSETNPDSPIDITELMSSCLHVTNESVVLRLESSIASLPLHDLETTVKSTEFRTPIGGNLSVDRIQRDSETNPDSPIDITELMSSCLHLEVPWDVDNQMYSEEQSEKTASELEKPRNGLEVEASDENGNPLPRNQWSGSLSGFSLPLEALPNSFSYATPSEARHLLSDEQAIMSLACQATGDTPEVGDSDNHSEWSESLRRFSPSLEALAHSFSPATPSETRNPQSGEHDITSLTCTAAAETRQGGGNAAETPQGGGNENHFEWSERLSQFSPSMEEFAHSFSPITLLDVGSPQLGELDITPLPWTVFEPLLEKENHGESTRRQTSHLILSLTNAHETEGCSTTTDALIAGGRGNHNQNQKRGVPGDHGGIHSSTSKKFLAADDNVLEEVTCQHLNEENKEPESSSVKQRLFSDSEKATQNVEISTTKSNIWSRRGRPAAVLQLQTGKARSKAKSSALKTHLENEQQHQDKKVNEIIKWDCSEDEEEIFTPDKENLTPETRLLKSLHKVGKMKIEEAAVDEEDEEIFTPDKENMTPNTRLLRSLHKIGKMKSEEEEEIYTPDKENMISNIRQLNSLRKMGKLKSEEIIHSRIIRKRSSSMFSTDIAIDNGSLCSEKSSKTLEGIRNQKTTGLQSVFHPLLEKITGTKKKSARMPFQSLEASSRSHCASPSLHATVGRKSAINEKQNTGKTFSNTCPDNEGQRMNWTMVVDIASLLDKESMKSLLLLRGLKGTRLMIPQMVVRELDCLKQRCSLFRRTTDIFSILEWIEVCIVTTPWWIHIQTSQEEQRSIVPTPPSSPFSPQFSVWGSQCEVNSPTTEDHILDYAMLLAKTQVDKHIILISNEATLKIKAMAEGILCETAHEFRASLLNPFSDRFMWTNSTARGQTWSGTCDEVLREIYHQRPSQKKQLKGERPSGLKLILLHNSLYGKQMICSK